VDLVVPFGRYKVIPILLKVYQFYELRKTEIAFESGFHP